MAWLMRLISRLAFTCSLGLLIVIVPLAVASRTILRGASQCLSMGRAADRPFNVGFGSNPVTSALESRG